MAFALFAITAFLGLHYSSASTQYLDQNPALQVYQDEASIFPLEEAWYIAYRNFESDPVFGGKAKCVRYSSNGVGEDGAYPVVFQYAPSFSANATVTLSLSPGYTIENVVNFEAQGQTNSVQGISAYSDVKKCSVLRLPYAGGNPVSFLKGGCDTHRVKEGDGMCMYRSATGLHFRFHSSPKKIANAAYEYLEEGKCALAVPESKLDNIDTCCNFIFDLLCGTTSKFNISDSTCG